MKRIGIDVGGTFTDVVLLDDSTGRVWSTKVPTTPHDRVVGTLNGFARILELSGSSSSEIAVLNHGTTMATNMIVEGTGAATALITTRGFRDILELRRVSRHDRADLYDLMFENPAPLVPRRWRLEVDERMAFDGTVERPLDFEALIGLADEIRKADDIEAVAVCLLHSYANPAHERAAVERLRELLPDRFVCASFEVNPEIMEYERTSSTVINAMLGPVCRRYINSLGEKLTELGFAGQFFFMQSNGGLADPVLVAEHPIVMLESGPAGGVSAAIRGCENANIRNAILGDMGGTTFDVSLIRDFQPELRVKTLLHTHTVRCPAIDIDSVGAGGGSIAWIDGGGGIRIGPRSAGADPGPACYGRGGKEATVTDCNLVLGYIDPKQFLGGQFELDAAAARQVIEDKLSRPLGITVEEAAQIVRSVANALMAQAVRIMTVERGHDPREFSYICYGGAGPLHALDIAEEMGIRRVLVPPLPGLYSAVGMTVADQQYDFQAPVDQPLDALRDEDIAGRLDQLIARGYDELRKVSVAPDQIEVIRRADCRYVGQPEAIMIDLPEQTDELGAAMRREFEEAHLRAWNFVSANKTIIVSNLRIQMVARTGWRGVVGGEGDSPAESGAKRFRKVHFDGKYHELAVLRRSSIKVGMHVKGPAVIEEDSSSILLRPSHEAIVDDHFNLVIELT